MASRNSKGAPFWSQDPYNQYVVVVQNWKLSKLKVVRIENCQNWKLPKLKVAKIESCQNWKLPKLKVGKIESDFSISCLKLVFLMN